MMSGKGVLRRTRQADSSPSQKSQGIASNDRLTSHLWEYIKRGKQYISMREQVSPLITFYKPGWENHHQAVVTAIAPLSPVQLALPVASHYRSIGELVAHMIGARIAWFSGWLGEEIPDMARWDELWFSDEQTVPDAAALVTMLEGTWLVISSALDRWTPAELEQLFQPPASHQEWLRAQGLEEEPPHTRQ